MTSLTRWLWVDLAALTIRRMGVTWRVGSRHLAIARWIDQTTRRSTILTWHLTICWLVAYWRQLRPNTGSVGGSWLAGLAATTGSAIAINLVGLGSSPFSLLGGLALIIFLLLSSFPFLADLFEFYKALIPC